MSAIASRREFFIQATGALVGAAALPALPALAAEPPAAHSPVIRHKRDDAALMPFYRVQARLLAAIAELEEAADAFIGLDGDEYDRLVYGDKTERFEFKLEWTQEDVYRALYPVESVKSLLKGECFHVVDEMVENGTWDE